MPMVKRRVLTEVLEDWLDRFPAPEPNVTQLRIAVGDLLQLLYGWRPHLDGEYLREDIGRICEIIREEAHRELWQRQQHERGMEDE